MPLVHMIENRNNAKNIPVPGYRKGAWAGYDLLFVGGHELTEDEIAEIERQGGVVTLMEPLR